MDGVDGVDGTRLPRTTHHNQSLSSECGVAAEAVRGGRRVVTEQTREPEGVPQTTTGTECLKPLTANFCAKKINVLKRNFCYQFNNNGTETNNAVHKVWQERLTLVLKVWSKLHFVMFKSVELFTEIHQIRNKKSTNKKQTNTNTTIPSCVLSGFLLAWTAYFRRVFVFLQNICTFKICAMSHRQLVWNYIAMCRWSESVNVVNLLKGIYTMVQRFGSDGFGQNLSGHIRLY